MNRNGSAAVPNFGRGFSADLKEKQARKGFRNLSASRGLKERREIFFK